MGDDRFHARSELLFGSQQAHHQPSLPRKTKESAGMYHHRSLPQEFERGFFFALQPGNSERRVPTRLHVQPAYQGLAKQDGVQSAQVTLQTLPDLLLRRPALA